MIFTMSLGTRSPVPQAWLLMRLTCSRESWSLPMLTLQSDPKPVVTP